MLNSLISNAVETMPNGGTLTVNGKSPEDRSRIEIKVIDTGHGAIFSQADCGMPLRDD